MLRHVRWAEIQPEMLNPLLERRFVTAENVTLARFLLRKGCVVPEHSHHNEQLSCVLEGALKFSFGAQEIVVRPGELVCIPAHQPHAAEALEDTLVLDVFSPLRTDWLQGDDAYLRAAQK